jgi:hypothetical protein
MVVSLVERSTVARRSRGAGAPSPPRRRGRGLGGGAPAPPARGGLWGGAGGAGINPGGEGPPLPDLRQSQMSLPERHPAPHRNPQAVSQPGVVPDIPDANPPCRKPVPHLASLVRARAPDEQEVRLRGKHLEALLGQHARPLGAAGDEDPYPALLLSLLGQHGAAGEHRGMAEVVGQLDLDQLRDQRRPGHQVAEAQAGERPGLGKGPEEDEVRVLVEQRPVVEAAELAVGVVEEERPFQALEERSEPFGRQRVPRGVVRRAEEHRPPRIALDLGLQLVHEEGGTREVRAHQEAGDGSGAHHEHAVEAEGRLDAEHLGARPGQGLERRGEQLVRAVAHEDALPRPAVQLAEVAAQGVAVEVRVAGPVGVEQALGHGELDPTRQVPGDLVLVQLVPAGGEVQVVGREAAHLGTHQRGGIDGTDHRASPPRWTGERAPGGGAGI